MAVRWIQTDKHVYGAIYREHREEFCVFGSCTCPDGDMELGRVNPYILTEWGFKEATEPLIKCEQSKGSVHEKEWQFKYFIASVICEEE